MVLGNGPMLRSDGSENPPPWGAYLVARQQRGSLVRVAREGRLLRNDQGSLVRVGLHLVDESILALADLALVRQSPLT